MIYIMMGQTFLNFWVKLGREFLVGHLEIPKYRSNGKIDPKIEFIVLKLVENDV